MSICRCLHILIVSLCAAMLSAQLTIDNPAELDAYKNSVFHAETGEPFFDSLYISNNHSDYYIFYHNTVDFVQNDRQRETATYSPATYTYLANLQTAITAKTVGYIGRVPRYHSDDPEWNGYEDLRDNLDKHYTSHDETFLHFYNTDKDGWLIDNLREEDITAYYGYYRIRRVRTYTVTQTKEMQQERSWNTWKAKWEYKDPVQLSYKETFDSTYTYTFIEKLNGADNASSVITEKPAWQETAVPDRESIKQQINGYSWDCAIGNCTLNEGFSTIVWDSNYKKKTYTQQRTHTETYTDEPVIWARRIVAEDGTARLDYLSADGQPLTGNIQLAFEHAGDIQTAYIAEYGKGELNRILYNVLQCDTIGQLRHHYMLCPQSALDNGSFSPDDLLDYYDITWYNSDMTVTTYTSNSQATYHEYDTDYARTGVRTRIQDSQQINMQTQSADNYARVYARQGNAYTCVRTLNYQDQRLGTIAGKTIFLAGNFAECYMGTATEACNGWGQLSNTEVYLENVTMYTQNSPYYTHQSLLYDMDRSGGPAPVNIDVTLPSSAVFLVTDGTSAFHLKGQNTLFGSKGGAVQLNLTITTTDGPYNNWVGHNKAIDNAPLLTEYRYCAPVEIQDGAAATVVFDAFWADKSNKYGSLYMAGAEESVAPLYTGGPNGTFRIDGGYITLQPAHAHKAYSFDYSYTHKVLINYTWEYHYTNLAPWSNYLLCGGGKPTLDATLQHSVWTVDQPGATSHPTNQIRKVDFPLFITGIGNGLPQGKLIINGGTLQSTVDMPFFAPNIEVNGGSVTPLLYNATAQSSAEQWENALEYNDALLNAMQQTLTRHEHLLPAALTDYSDWTIQTVNQDYENDYAAALCLNKATDIEYYYGTVNVRSDEAGKAFFYHPTDYEWQKNFVVGQHDILTDWGTNTAPYHLTVYHGGHILLTDDYQLLGIPRYYRSFTDDVYHTLCMPFEVKKVWETEDGPDTQITAYIEADVNPDADNSMAYFYLYHLQDNKTYGLNDLFRSRYTTHTDGTFLHKAQPYIIKFPSGESYWENIYTVFEGEAGAVVNGADSYATVERPASQEGQPADLLEFRMGGNPTFAPQTVRGEFYRVDHALYGNDDYHAVTDHLLPCEAYVLSDEPTMQLYRILGRHTDVTTPITDTDLLSWNVKSGNGHILVMADNECTLTIYTMLGQLCHTASLPAHTEQAFPLPAGLYYVAVGTQGCKALVY